MVSPRKVWSGLVLTWALACSGGGERASERAERGPAGGAATEGPGLATSCGDFACAWGESCESCPVDCGACAQEVELWLTEPVREATSALSEGTIGGLERQLLEDLAAAQGEIRVAIYALSRRNVAEELARARGRGVDVRLVTECENRSGTQQELLMELLAIGVAVQDDQSSFAGLDPSCPEPGGSMHHKFAVIDRRLVWAGSANLTATDLNYNHNHAFRIEDEALAAYFLAEWEDLWVGHFGIEKEPRAALRVQSGGSLVEVAFSPRRTEAGESVSRALLLDLLGRARSSVLFAAFTLTDEAVALDLEQGSRAVLGVVDASSAGQSSSRARELCGHGVDVVVENLPGKVHHKLLALDAGEADGVVLGGSANWSQAGFDENDETLLALKDAALARQAGAEVKRLAEDPAHGGGACCFHSAEAFDDHSPRCGDAPCVCQNGLDDDFDGYEDEVDSSCAAAFSCSR